MNILEIARKLAALGQSEKACEAYELMLGQETDQDPEVKLEAAVYILRMGGNYKAAYTVFAQLYGAGHFREECLDIMRGSFYLPNIKLLKSRYERNCKRLKKYPYLFRRDFPAFEDLPIQFYPFDDKGYLPFDIKTQEFGNYVNPGHPVVSRNFFKNLDDPILAENVFSQYELEYLCDNVRKSEWVGRENHIYLHYPDWGTFCAYLQVWNLRPVLEEKKIVFLIGDEISQYPIDFKERFGMDYSQFPVKPVGVREIHKLIWHTQLSSHNGGDFFNEIFDAHPNLISVPSVMFEDTVKTVATYRKHFESAPSLEAVTAATKEWSRPELAVELYNLKGGLTDKDILVAMFLIYEKSARLCDPASRIVPALFFQPHFYNVICSLHWDEAGWAVLESDAYEQIRDSPLFTGFKYIKTFTPLRRFTTSHGATVKFMLNSLKEAVGEGKRGHMPDAITQRVLNRSFMVDPQDRLYQDSVLVRFEDGKLNPKATFTALAAFLDLPYTPTMTYCSLFGERDPESLEGNDIGFSTAAIYRTYDDYTNDSERYYIEYFLRDAYAYYGYDFHYYDGAPVDAVKLTELINGFGAGSDLIRQTLRKHMEVVQVSRNDGSEVTKTDADRVRDYLSDSFVMRTNENRLKNGVILLKGLRFINKSGQPLRMMPKLELDPKLLEQPLYR